MTTIPQSEIAAQKEIAVVDKNLISGLTSGVTAELVHAI